MPTLSRISAALRNTMRNLYGSSWREAAQIMDGAKGLDPTETHNIVARGYAAFGPSFTDADALGTATGLDLRQNVTSATEAYGISLNPQTVTMSGTPTLFASLRARPPASMAGVAPTVATTIYVSAAPSGGTTNYSIWVDSGDVRLDGDLIFNGATGDNQIVLVDNLAAALGVQISGGATLMNFKTSSEVVQVKRLSIPETADAAGTCLSMEPNLNPGPSGDAAPIFLTSGSITTQNNGESVFAIMLDDGQAAVVEHTTINICGIFMSAMTADASTAKTTTNAATLYIQGAPILTNITATNGPYSLFVAGGDSRFSGRVLGLLETVASATTITLQSNAAVFTGTTTINHITTTNWIAGSSVTLLFGTSLTVTHNAGSPPANTAPILLSGAANFSATANDSLTLMWDGTNWRETARTVI